MIKNKELKRRAIQISYDLKLGHIGSVLTAMDIIDEIYKIKKPDEKFILSAGHAHLAHLVMMQVNGLFLPHYKGTIPSEERIQQDYLGIIVELIEKYGIHCDRQAGCDVSTGSLGHGIGIAVGMALADRAKDVYCLLSDGECAEGSVMEAVSIAAQQRLTNLKIYINFNGWAAYRKTVADQLTGDLIKVIHTNMNDYPEWLQGQVAHYKVLNESEYNELMELLK